MREILFRGKTETEKWVYGALDNTLNWADFIIVHENGFGIKNRVLPESIGQFTGLTDKNGTKIFEGDIILHGTVKSKSTVIFKQGSFALNNEKSRHDTCVRHYDLSECEIIGNIHENTELLK